jgi:beta-ureidopropionase
MLGLKRAQITFNPSATVESLSRHLSQLEQPAHAVANGFFVGAIIRVGEELVPGARFYGSSYFCDPRGQIIAQASDSADEILVADLDLTQIEEVRTTWQFFRDRRPETYHELAGSLP